MLKVRGASPAVPSSTHNRMGTWVSSRSATSRIRCADPLISGPLTFGRVTSGISLVHTAEPQAQSHGPLTATLKTSPEPSAATSTSQFAAETGQSRWIYNFYLTH